MSQAKDTAPSILERLSRGEVLISDGATGTFLQDHGLEPGGCPEEFNVTHPEVVRLMASEFFAAGSDIVLTATFGGSRFMLKKYGHERRVAEINRLAARHARSVAPAGRYVLGSVGPTGEFIEPLGQVTEAEMLEAFTEQIGALAEGGVDGVVIETMIAVEEAALAVRAARQFPNLTIAATMTYEKGPRGFFSVMGVTPERGVRELQEAGAHIVGANCGNGIDGMIEVAREIRQATDGYVLIHSNAGIPRVINNTIVYPETPEYMAERFKTLVDLGVNIVGGCCGTTPAHIRALSRRLRNGPPELP